MLLSLAPMDGITDAAFRKTTEEIFKQFGEKENQLILTTEFMSADGFVANPGGVAKHLLMISKDEFRRWSEADEKVINIAQIFGGNEENLIKAALWIKENLPWYNLVELNIGCPAPKICKIGAGSAMMKNKEKTLQIIKNLSQILDGNFSIKTRIGLTKEDIPAQTEFVIKASKYCKIITIHGRTFDQQHSGEVNRQAIYKIKEKIKNNCKIIGNGGIKSYQEIQEKIGNLDGIAIGQGAIGNPRIFTPHQPNWKEKKKTILRHLDLFLFQENRWQNVKNLLDKTKNKQHQLDILKIYLLIPYLQTSSDFNHQKSPDFNLQISSDLTHQQLPNSSSGIIRHNLQKSPYYSSSDIITYLQKSSGSSLQKSPYPSSDIIRHNHQQSPIIPFRKHLFSYLKGYPNAKQIKQQIIQTDSMDKLKDIISKL